MAARNYHRTAKLSLLLAIASVVCLAQILPSEAANYAAKAITITGQVSVLRDSQPWAISAGDSIQVQQMILTGPDGHAVFQVSDGSTFEVYPNSHVVFRKNLFNWRDLLDVLVGKVRVHIEHLGTIPNPNRVVTPTAIISVRGTTFDISVDDDDDTTVVEVEEGLVEVQHALLPRGNAVMVAPGETLRVYKNEPLANNLLDKGTVARQVFRAVMDALATVGTRSARVGSVGGGSTTSGGSVGDSTKTAPPPPTAPPTLGPPALP